MSDYLFYVNQDRSPADRYLMERNPGEGYAFEGIEYWQRYMGILSNILSDEITEEELEVIRIDITRELLEIDNITDYNVYNDPLNSLYSRSPGELILTLLLRLLQKHRGNVPYNPCLRLFISHRKDDKDYALRMAYIARQCGFAFWVDVLDPDLRNASGKNLDHLYVACKIEMALLNCTHVIACMTPHTRGGMWVPYEYGRVRKFPGISINTCAWLHPDIKNDPIPEYMRLGYMALEENHIQLWLDREYSISNKTQCRPENYIFNELENTKSLPVNTSEELSAENLKKHIDIVLRRDIKPLKRIKLKNQPPADG